MKKITIELDEKLIKLIELRGGQEYLKALITETIINNSVNLYESEQIGFKDIDFKDFYDWSMPLWEEARKYLLRKYQ